LHCVVIATVSTSTLCGGFRVEHTAPRVVRLALASGVYVKDLTSFVVKGVAEIRQVLEVGWCMLKPVLNEPACSA